MAEEHKKPESNGPESQEIPNNKDLLEKAKASLQEITKIKKQAESNSNNLSSLKQSAENNVTQLVTDIKSERDDAISLLETIKKHQADTKLIAQKATEKDQKVNEYKEKLDELTEEYKNLNERINDLLPGATSTGLAKAFKARKDTFRTPKILWAIVQVLAVVLLIGAGYLVFTTAQVHSFSEWMFYIVRRTPIIGAIIVLEEIARRNRNIALRLDEDYGYKEALSHSFEGYKKEMKEIDQKPNSAVTKLSSNLLEALAKEPGRLIDQEKPLQKPCADELEQLVNIFKQWKKDNTKSK